MSGLDAIGTSVLPSLGDRLVLAARVLGILLGQLHPSSLAPLGGQCKSCATATKKISNYSTRGAVDMLQCRSPAPRAAPSGKLRDARAVFLALRWRRWIANDESGLEDSDGPHAACASAFYTKHGPAASAQSPDGEGAPLICHAPRTCPASLKGRTVHDEAKSVGSSSLVMT